MSHAPDAPTIPAPEGRTWHLLWVGALMVLVLLACAGFYSNPSISMPRLPREIFTWCYTLGLMFLFAYGYKSAQSEHNPLRVIVLLAVALAVAAFLIPPFHSTDIFGYINRGWQQVGYGANPYVLTVDDITGWEDDPMFTNHWVNNPSPYGFLYIQIARLLASLGAGNFGATVLIFKAFNVLVHGAIAALVYWGARLNHVKRPELALYLYAWNPLILLHMLANGHNDLVMGLFVTLSGVLALAGAWLWVIPALVAGTFTKYGALVILPLAGLYLIRLRAWGALAGGLAIGTAIFLLSGWPYLPDWAHFKLGAIQENAQVSHASLHSFLHSIYKQIIQLMPVCDSEIACDRLKDTGRAIFKYILLSGYAGFYLWMLWRIGRKQAPTAKHFVENALLTLALLVCLISLKFYPWYLGMFFPLALMLEQGHGLRRALVLVSVMQMFSFTFIGQAHMLNFILMLALPLLWVGWQERRRRRHSFSVIA